MRSRSSKRGVPVFLCALLCGGLAAGDLSAQGAAAKAPAAKETPAAGLPDAKSILNRHAEVAGGLANFKARKSTKVVGTMSFPANGMVASMET